MIQFENEKILLEISTGKFTLEKMEIIEKAKQN